MAAAIALPSSVVTPENVLALTREGGRFVVSADRLSLTYTAPGKTPVPVLTVAAPKSVTEVMAGATMAGIKVRHGATLNAAWSWFVWSLTGGSPPHLVATTEGAGDTTTDPSIFAKPVVTKDAFWWNRSRGGTYVVSKFDAKTAATSDVLTSHVVEGLVGWRDTVLARTGTPGTPSAARFVRLAPPGDASSYAPDVRSLRFIAAEGTWLVGASGSSVAWLGNTAGTARIAAPLQVNDNISVSEGVAVLNSNMAFPYLLDLSTGAMAPLLPAGHTGTAVARNGWLLVRDGTGRAATRTSVVKLSALPKPSRC